jgi:hypothetical protein
VCTMGNVSLSSTYIPPLRDLGLKVSMVERSHSHKHKGGLQNLNFPVQNREQDFVLVLIRKKNEFLIAKSDSKCSKVL